MKKLLLVATRQFWPISGGKELTLYYNCKGLHEKYGYNIYLFCFIDKNTDTSVRQPDFIEHVKYCKIPNLIQGACNIVFKSVFGEYWPIQNSIYFSNNSRKILIDYYNLVKPDVLFVDMIRLVPYAEALKYVKIPKILIEDDLLDKRYSRQLRKSESAGITGQFSGNLPVVANKIVNNRMIKRMVLRSEISRIQRYEKRCDELFDFVTFISPIETKEYNKRYHSKKGVTLTTGADIEFYMSGVSNQHIPKSLSIVANFTTSANADSIEMICSRIIPKLDKDIKYYVMGKCPDTISERFKSDNIIFLGFVDDIRSVVMSTDLYLCPMAYGTGIKTKIVEAMAMGMCVVTNSIGAEGLNITNGKELYVCDSDDEICECVNTLLADDDLRRQIGDFAQNFVKENHTWGKVYETFGVMGL